MIIPYYKYIVHFRYFLNLFKGQETIVTYAYGYMFQLRDMGEYAGETDWHLEGLPLSRLSYGYFGPSSRKFLIF